MSRFPNGQPVRLTATIKDITGAPVNAGALTLLVKTSAADGTWTVTGTYASPVNDAVGSYHQDIPVTDLAVNGHYQYTWTSTGTGAGVSRGEFDVFDPFETAVLPLQDAKAMLNETDTANDAEIQSFIDTIRSSLEQATGGPVVNRTITERVELTANQTVLVLRQRPVVSVTSITSVSSGQPIDISAGLDIDTNAGTVRRQLGYPFYGPFFQWLPIMNVTYVAGWGTQVPAAFNTFARIVLQHLWTSQRGPSTRPSMGSGDLVTIPGFGFMVPNQAAEVLSGSQGGIPFRQEAFV